MDALQNARSANEAYYLLKKSDPDESANPYDNDPEYTAVYCMVGGVQYRATVASCAQDGGEATPVR